MNNVKCIYPESSIYRFPGYIQDTRLGEASGNKKFPGAMLPLFDQNLQTSCLNFLSRSSPSSLPEVIQLHRNCAVLGWNSDFHTCARFQSLNSSAIAIASQFALNRPKTDLLGAFIHSQARMREALKRANVKVNKFPSSVLSLFFWRK